MILEVKVKPGAGKDLIKSFKEPNFLEVTLKAKAENNQANESLIKFLRKTFKIPEESIKIVKGRTSRKKLVKIEGLSEEEFLKVVKSL
ncbi:MAG: YggU family protein [Thermodesulfobacteria bacterium]|nr:YggU family protein [Thermodesulfobacteriota bacterium]